MKKIILSILLIGTFLASNSFAIDTAKINNDIAVAGLNLQGDTLYLPVKGEVAIGMGTTLAIAKGGLLELRGEAASIIGSNAHAISGIGIGVSIPKLIEAIGGQWALSGIDAGIFVAGMLDMSDKAKLVPAIGLTILKVNF